jgi:hypothetical protein
MEWPREAWFHYLGVRCTLELAKAVVGWSPGYFFACPHCGMALVVRHDATHVPFTIQAIAASTNIRTPDGSTPGTMRRATLDRHDENNLPFLLR